MKESADHCNDVQNHKANTRAWQQLINSLNLELVRGNYLTKGEQYYSEQQVPSSQQLVHLMMAR
jgi:hypothetical protein